MKKILEKIDQGLKETKTIISKLEKEIEELKSLNKVELPNDLLNGIENDLIKEED
jgi:hypothetical protein